MEEQPEELARRDLLLRLYMRLTEASKSGPVLWRFCALSARQQAEHVRKGLHPLNPSLPLAA